MMFLQCFSKSLTTPDSGCGVVPAVEASCCWNALIDWEDCEEEMNLSFRSISK